MKKELEDFPDDMSVSDISSAIDSILTQPAGWKDCRARLESLSDRQWHTYEAARDSTKSSLENWIINNWKNDSEYAEMTLGLAYSFGLSKSIFTQALAEYSGIHREEFMEILDRSNGSHVDPYWSLRSRD
jgi:hypothetical protein